MYYTIIVVVWDCRLDLPSLRTALFGVRRTERRSLDAGGAQESIPPRLFFCPHAMMEKNGNDECSIRPRADFGFQLRQGMG